MVGPAARPVSPECMSAVTTNDGTTHPTTTRSSSEGVFAFSRASNTGGTSWEEHRYSDLYADPTGMGSRRDEAQGLDESAGFGTMHQSPTDLDNGWRVHASNRVYHGRHQHVVRCVPRQPPVGPGGARGDRNQVFWPGWCPNRVLRREDSVNVNSIDSRPYRAQGGTCMTRAGGGHAHRIELVEVQIKWGYHENPACDDGNDRQEQRCKSRVVRLHSDLTCRARCETQWAPPPAPAPAGRRPAPA